jgi:endonuclease/exonuclease/phosphatase family metal-dependent hydrolase
MRLGVATHNLMHGLRLSHLLPHYAELRDRVGLDLLCVQENRFGDGRPHAPTIAQSLGEHYEQLCHDDAPRLAMVFDGAGLRCVDHLAIPLPKLASLSWFERLYIAGGKTRQKHAQVAVFRPATGEPFAVANFHLDTAGDNRHRGAQVATIAEQLGQPGWSDRVIACGDTNAFTRGRRRHLAALSELLAPLTALGAVDPDTAPTHFFARQNEPKLAHQTGRLLGKLGIDLPRRYDVMCTNMPTAERGQVETPDSDHDMVWARISS